MRIARRAGALDKVKRCSKCGEEKPGSEFGKDKSKKDGIRSQCNECRKICKRTESDKKYYIAHKQQITIAHALYRSRNIDKTRKRDKARYYRELEAHREKARKRSKKNYSMHNETITEKRRNHPEWAARGFIKHTWGLSDPPQELIDLKVEQIRLFRAVRDKRMEVSEHEG